MCLSVLMAIAVLVVANAHASPTGLFDDDAMLRVTLTGPIRSITKNKNERDELPFILEADGRQHAVLLRARGKSRLTLCRFPLLRVRFQEGDSGGSMFAGQDKLKLVTQCNKNSSARTDLIQEYAAYRIFSLISDVGYRVRLLHIEYVDTGGRSDTFERYGFLLESQRELGARTGTARVQVDGVSLSALDDRQLALVFVFHYLIGNADFSLVTADGADSCCHNGHIFADSETMFLVPHDFDLSGLVNAGYARSNALIAVKNVRRRRYGGYCIPTDAVAGALAEIVAARPRILGVIDTVRGLEAKDRADSKKYLEKFFERAEEPEELLRYFARKCMPAKR